MRYLCLRKCWWSALNKVRPNSAISIPKGHDEHPLHFYMPPPPEVFFLSSTVDILTWTGSQMVGQGRSRCNASQAKIRRAWSGVGRSGGRKKKLVSFHDHCTLLSWSLARASLRIRRAGQLYSQARKTGKKTILKSWSNRPFPAKQSHGTKTPCWNAKSAVRPWNESSTSNSSGFPTSPRKLIRPFPLRFRVLSLSTSPYTFVIFL